jgi:hypothetical protein
MFIGQGVPDDVAGRSHGVPGQAGADDGLFDGVDAQVDRADARGQQPLILPERHACVTGGSAGEWVPDRAAFRAVAADRTPPDVSRP